MFLLTGLNLAVGHVTVRSVMRIRLFLFLTGLFFALNCTQAALMRPLGIDELTRKADLIIRGTVLDKTSLRDEAGRIYTRVNVRVSEVWKGALPANAAPNSLAIVQSGGTLGDVREEVSGEVQYSVGEEFVVFLVLNQRGEPVTIGLAQGKFHVWRDPQTGEKFVHNPFHGEPEPAGAGSQDKLRVSELKQQVRQVIP
jgi:hypothetical protein